MTFRIALFGASPDTQNMGVSALFMSAIAGIAQHIYPVEFVVFDNGLGRREEVMLISGSKEVRLIRFGARGGHRYYRPENLSNMLFASRFGSLGAIFNEGVRLIDSCAAVLDVSGGDSFSDIYGSERFNNVFRPKAIAINRGVPLILLPQTYGPYKDQKVQTLAAFAVSGARMAWARDQDSFTILKELAGESFNPEVHRCGVDMAFSLPAIPAGNLLSEILRSWLNLKTPDIPLVGFNISGLIYNDPQGANSKYGLKADYQKVVIGFLTKILAETSAKIVLIPHVMDQPGHYESDLAASEKVVSQLGEQNKNRVEVAPITLNQSQVKWLIGQMDWFCGTRMHSTIAGLSSRVPTATISYSDKARGVFESCGQASQVFDPRKLPANTIIDNLWQSFFNRYDLLRSLTVSLPKVNELSISQIKTIAEHIQCSNSEVAGDNR